ncbi:MAG: response regulator transcription factor [Pseudomonadota bacterium]
MTHDVLIISRSGLLAETLSLRFEENFFRMAGRSESLPEGMSIARREGRTIDLVLIERPADYEMLDRDLKRLRQVWPKSRVLVIDDTLTIDTVGSAFDSGADGFLTSDIDCETLTLSLRLLLKGEKVFPRDFADIIADLCSRKRFLIDEDDVFDSLSERERQVIRCVADGLPNKTIANTLNMSEASVKSDVKAALRKLGVANRTQLAICAIRRGWVTPEVQPRAIAN